MLLFIAVVALLPPSYYPGMLGAYGAYGMGGMMRYYYANAYPNSTSQQSMFSFCDNMMDAFANATR